MSERPSAIVGALATGTGLMVLSTGIFLSPHAGLDPVEVAVLLLSTAGAMQVVLRLRGDLALGAAMALAFFLPYAVVAGTEIRVSGIVPVLLMVAALVLTVHASGIDRGIVREPFVRWMTAYIVVVCLSTSLNAGRLTPQSAPFLIAWLLIQVFFLAYVFYRPHMTIEAQLSIARRYLDVLVAVAVIAVALGVVEYLRPGAVQSFFAPQARVERWGERGALSGWIIPLKRTGSLVGSPNAFGALITMGFLVLVGGGQRRSVRRAVLAVLLAAGVVGLSTSRGATVGLLSGVAVYAMTSKRRIWAVPLLAGALMIGAFMPVTAEFIGRGYVPKNAELARSIPSAAERLFLWQRALSGGRDPLRWLIGGGPINEPFVHRTALRGGHDLLVTNLAFFGLVGLTCVVALCREVLRALGALYRDRRTRELSRIGLALFVALLAHSLVDDMLFYNTAVMLAFFPLLAMLIRLRRLLAGEREVHSPDAYERAHGHAGVA